MTKLYCALLMTFSLLSIDGYAQVSLDSAGKYTVQLEAQVQESPPQVTLSWTSFPDATSFGVYRKAKNAVSWGNAVATLPGSATSYVDNSVVSDSAYEYYVAKTGGAYATGYIYAGIKAPAIHNRGALLLLVDSTFTDSCSAEIAELINDISADGWEVLRNDYARSASDVTIRNYIMAQRQSKPSLNAVFILGHIKVPYSGNLNPDAHPNHKGAWPADAYYADIDGTWTDVTENTDNNGSNKPSRTQNENKPGDGKWDQSEIPSAVELQVSRVDFADMPAFAKTEIQMMKSYLAKDHQYKIAGLFASKRELVDDNFGISTQEPFAANALRLSAMVGRASIVSKDFITTLDTSSYQWAYGCGGGSYSSCSGVGTTTNFTSKNMNAIFTMLFGSYFGDWDAQNNLLRAPLCTNTPALTSCWAGRPHWFLHHMALGENIGYSTRLTQNNTGGLSLYNVYYNNAHSGVHIALMGDLTLRTDYFKQASAVSFTSAPAVGATISWTASPVPVAGYYVYRSETEFGSYDRRSPLVTGTSFTDSFGTAGTKYYMVRAVVLQVTPSGSYYNLSLGAKSAPGNASYPKPFPDAISTVPAYSDDISIFPNPATDKLNLLVEVYTATSVQLKIMDMQGRTILAREANLHTGANTITFDIKSLPPNVYSLSLQSNTASCFKKWIKIDR